MCWWLAAAHPAPRLPSRPRAPARDVVLLERYNHLGGLSTGGLVIWIDRMTDWSGEAGHPRHCERSAGPAAEGRDRRTAARACGASRMRLPPRIGSERTAVYHGIVTWSPTIDPERLKLASQELVLESRRAVAAARLGAAPIMRRWSQSPGVVFESKEGRLAIRAQRHGGLHRRRRHLRPRRRRRSTPISKSATSIIA